MKNGNKRKELGSINEEAMDEKEDKWRQSDGIIDSDRNLSCEGVKRIVAHTVQCCIFLSLNTSLYSSAAFFTIMLEMPSPTAGGAGAGVLESSVPLLMSSARRFSSAAILLLMADWSSRYNSMALRDDRVR